MNIEMKDVNPNYKPALGQADKLRKQVEELCEQIGLDGAGTATVMEVVMASARNAWISGKEFGWKKAWNWKKTERGMCTACADKMKEESA